VLLTHGVEDVIERSCRRLSSELLCQVLEREGRVYSKDAGWQETGMQAIDRQRCCRRAEAGGSPHNIKTRWTRRWTDSRSFVVTVVQAPEGGLER
jgi:hypothetical protein